MEADKDKNSINDPHWQGFLSWAAVPLSLGEAADQLQVSVPTLRTMIRSGKIRTVIVGTRPRLLRAEIVRFYKEAGSTTFDYTKLLALYNGLAGAI